MFDLNKLKRPALSFSAAAFILSLMFSTNPARAQDVQSVPDATQIKPPMVKPPMDSAPEAQGSVRSTSRSRKLKRRRRRARNKLTTKREIIDVPIVTGIAGDSADGVDGQSSTKPPKANNGSGAALNKSATSRAPISAGVLNGRAISLPRPAYPPIARAARAKGVVVVEVIIDETGHVMTARAISGHPLLQAAAVQAAWQARFAPTLLSGQPVKVAGTISYNFTLP
jgi:protein TonB